MEKTCLYQNGGMGGHHRNKAAVKRLSRIKLLSVLQPRASQSPHPQPDTKMAPRVDQSSGGPIPVHGHRARKRGSWRRPGISSQTQRHRDSQSEIRQAVRTCYFFCGGAQKSSVIIANDVLCDPRACGADFLFQRETEIRVCTILFLFLPLFIF